MEGQQCDGRYPCLSECILCQTALTLYKVFWGDASEIQRNVSSKRALPLELLQYDKPPTVLLPELYSKLFDASNPIRQVLLRWLVVAINCGIIHLNGERVSLILFWLIICSAEFMIYQSKHLIRRQQSPTSTGNIENTSVGGAGMPNSI